MLDGRQPVALALVTAVPLDEANKPQVGATTASGETAADGRLTLTGLDRGPYRLTAVAPDGRTVANEVGFPASGPLRGVMLLHPYGPPSSMDLVMPAAAPYGEPVPVTVTVTDEHDQPCQDGTAIKLSTDFGVLVAGKQRSASITATTKHGEAFAKLVATRPGHATITAKHGDREVDAAAELHGALAYLLLELGPREPVNSYGATPPGADIPILCTACDADGHPIPNVPVQVWVQPLPNGRTVAGRTITGADGKVQVTALTDREHTSYRVTAAHGKLVAVREYLVAEPARPWVEASATWQGVVGELALRLHADEVSGEMLTIVAEPDDRVLLLDDAGDDAGMPMVDDEGAVTVTLLRVKPGPVDLRIDADGVYSAYLPLGGELVLPEPGPPVTDMPLPAAAYREAGAAGPVPEWSMAVAAPLGFLGFSGAGPLHSYHLRRTSRLLLEGETEPHGLPLACRPLGVPGLVYAVWDEAESRRSFVVKRHILALGQTIEDDYRAKLLPMKTGFLQVHDLAADGRRALATTRPWLGNGGLTPLWVMDRFGNVDLVCADWRQIDRANFAGDGVEVRGDRGARRYEPVLEAADGA